MATILFAGAVTANAQEGPVGTLTGDSRDGAVRYLKFSDNVALRPSANSGMPLQVGPKRYIAILCKYADSVAIPKPREYYEQFLNSNVYPGVAHWFNEVSGGRISFSAQVVGWYTLPRPASYYLPGAATSPNLLGWTNDCTTAADADVFFPQYDGIIMIFNGRNGGWSWGGFWQFTRDGVFKRYNTTWLANWATYNSIFAHELGHSFGWPHSSGGYTEVYDSKWDVMSGGSFNDPNVGMPIGNHTIAWHKETVGWIDAARILTPPLATSRSYMLERSAQPGTAGYLEIKWPLIGDRFYTLEARRWAGYDDQRLPVGGLGGLVMHRVDPALREPAHVVDIDNNGNPNDAGAAWTVGEVYDDSINGVSFSVDSIYSSGFWVTATRGWRLIVSALGGGTVNAFQQGFSCAAATCETVSSARGTIFNLQATPPSGLQFLGWGGACTGTDTCSVTMNGTRFVTASFGLPIAILSASARPAGVLGVAYADTLRASGGQGNFRYRVKTGRVPGGLLLDSITGRISGTPSEVGNFTFTVTVRSAGAISEREFTIAVPTPVLLSTTEARPVARMGSTYSSSIASAHPAKPAYRALDGMPAGLAIDMNGNIYGIPEERGAFTFNVSAQLYTLSVTQRYQLKVEAPVLVHTTVIDELLGKAGLSEDDRRFLDLIGNRNGRFDIGDVRAWLMEQGIVRARLAR